MKDLLQIQTLVPSYWKGHGEDEDYRYVWAIVGAGIGFIGGVLAPLVGAGLTVFSWIEGNASPGPLLYKVGTICFYLTVPLLIFGGCCLDALEKRGWKIR